MPRPARHADRSASTASANVAPAASRAVNDELFLEPMMGTPLAIFIEKDAADRDQLAEIIVKHGGTVSPGYSGVPYILVDPHSESGQSLYRQYAGKKGKIVLSSDWIHECVRTNELQTYHTNWAGCKVTGTEQVTPRVAPSANSTSSNQTSAASQRVVHSHPHIQQLQPPNQPQPQVQSQHQHPSQPQPQHQLQHQPQSQSPSHPANHAAAYAHQPLHPAQAHILNPAAQLGPPGFPYPVYSGQGAPHHASRASMAPPGGPPQSWQTSTSITPHHHPPHIQMLPPRAQNPYARDDHWGEPGPAFAHLAEAHLPPMNDAQTAAYYDHRYRDSQHSWPDTGQDYYDQSQTYDAPYESHQEQYVPLTGSSSTGLEQTPVPTPSVTAPAPESTTSQDPIPGPSSAPALAPALPSSPREDNRGRRRTRAQPQSAAPASSLVLNRRHPPARSPTPPTRIIKSTYGGNLFTADDIEYLKKYIDYCQEQGLVLSLREICERIAVKAPHHTFYSWRRYCNKHQIRLGGYAMDVESRSPSPGRQENEPSHFVDNGEALTTPVLIGEGPFTIDAAQRIYQAQGMRNRSPTPPRSLFRSTTGKGVAFTVEDVAFLCKFMAHRKLHGRLDMVTFWKDVSNRAPHHSRASWMKYYRRHKHELNRVEGDEPLPVPPSKKMRYGRNDDILLAQYFASKPEGTSDKIFQDFAKIYTHHPWKGWQEHHRIHKAKIDHLIQRMRNGERLEIGDDDD